MIKKFVSTTLGITGLAVLIGASGIMCAMNTAQAQYVGPNQTQTYTTVSQILKNPVDDQYFNLKGKITDKQGHERYTFTDSTGSIRAEIDDDRFMGVEVTRTPSSKSGAKSIPAAPNPSKSTSNA